ncbi:response regulator [Candidatus Daviesbacteria bacterium]|nr:response regulator [Candidatus Daviesbacteria bacterium]
MDQKKILLIEDDLFIRELYERTLGRAGYQVITAPDGEAGLTQAKDKPDIILLDIMLPKINGINVLKKLKIDSDTKDIPVVLLTNLGQESIVKEAFKIGASGYLMKMHLTPYEVVSHVKDFFENPNYKMDVSNLNLE